MKRFHFEFPEQGPATLATSATFHGSEPTCSSCSDCSSSTSTDSQNLLAVYLDYLASWRPDLDESLPDVPGLQIPPDRAVAWAVWWEAVYASRGNNRS